MGYLLVKLWIKAGLHLYFGKIKVEGLENVPKDAPVLFLPNHQSALLDVLLIAVHCNRKPYFLTRSDVFIGNFFKAIFSFFQMIPIYRIRDGRESLKNNQVVFDHCAELLIKKEAILMFPEANHNLQRRVRPLSKGFTRILFHTLNKAPDTDIQIIAVGINYKNAMTFPDKMALYFDTPITINVMYDPKNEKGSVDSIKEMVSSRLKCLTTHIADEETYAEMVKKLEAIGVDYLNPNEVNTQLQDMPNSDGQTEKEKGIVSKMAKLLFLIINLPIVFVWRTFVKPKVWEPEFLGTLRFGYALLAIPLYLTIIFAITVLIINAKIGLLIVAAIFLYNWMFVRWH